MFTYHDFENQITRFNRAHLDALDSISPEEFQRKERKVRTEETKACAMIEYGTACTRPEAMMLLWNCFRNDPEMRQAWYNSTVLATNEQ